MIKNILLSLLLLFAFTTTAAAHTGLETSSPKKGEVVTEQVQQISLDFETKVEKGSTFVVNAVNGPVVHFANITLDEHQMTGTVEQPLENGEYLVQWEIIGADGHPIEGEFTFFVEMEQTEEVEEEPIDEESGLGDDPNPAPPSSDKTENQQEPLSDSVLITILIILILIIVGTFLIFFRRKK
ncbi:copper resistance protein CopC [Mesobacillus sp. LC4]